MPWSFLYVFDFIHERYTRFHHKLIVAKIKIKEFSSIFLFSIIFSPKKILKDWAPGLEGLQPYLNEFNAKEKTRIDETPFERPYKLIGKYSSPRCIRGDF